MNNNSKTTLSADSATILNIERSPPVNAGRTFSVVNPSGAERKPRVAAYCRVSSDSEEQLGSYASQVRHYTAVISENPDWELADIYADEAETGLSTVNRMDFRRLMNDCRQGKIDRVLCKSVSRFARNYTDCIENIRELKSLGVTVLFEKEGIDTAKMTSEMFLSLQALKAQRESLSISGNMKRGNQMRMKNGTFITPTAPYGYRLNNKALVIQSDEAAVVHRIFADYLSGEGMTAIAAALNRDGVPCHKKQASWHSAAVRYILTNVAYTGDALWQKTYATDTLPIKQAKNKGELPQYYVTNDHAPIISREDFERVQDLLKQRGEQFGGDGAVVNGERSERALSRKICCGECGGTFRYKAINGTDYWTCRRHDSGKSLCPVTQVPEREILSAFTRLSDKLREYADYVIAPMIEQLESVAERRQRGNTKLAEINRDLAELMGQLHALNRLKSKGITDAALFAEKSNEMNKKLTAARHAKARLLAEDGQSDKARSVYDLLDALNSDVSETELFGEIIERVTVGADDTLTFKLKCGLELTESFERAVRFRGVAAQDSVRLCGL
jgi:DNA invertase Pin-like site-specific DNA recombinase